VVDVGLAELLKGAFNNSSCTF